MLPTFIDPKDLVERADASQGIANAMNTLGPIVSLLGVFQKGLGAYSSAQNAKKNLEYQSQISAINARMAEVTSQEIYRAGEIEQGNVSLKAGKVIGSQRASQGARGIVAGVGNAAEEIATTNLMKETDRYSINAATVRQAMAAKTQAVNYRNQGIMQGASASSISPIMAAVPSMLEGAGRVAGEWYKKQRKSIFTEKAD